MGLHLHNVSPKLDPQERELCACVWYSIYYVETTICTVTGRPSAIDEKEYSAPIPAGDQQDDNERKPDAFYSAFLGLSTIAARVRRRLYSAQSMKTKRNRSVVQQDINDLHGQLEAWKEGLPLELDFSKSQATSDAWKVKASHPICPLRFFLFFIFLFLTLFVKRADLMFRYYNLEILIYRPCLRPAEDSVTQESTRSRDFNRTAARACIEAAQNLIDSIILSKETLPWWCLLHFMVCATAILMLGMVRQLPGSTHTEKSKILHQTKRALNWLKETGAPTSSQTALELASQRSYEQLSQLLDQIMGNVNISLTGAWNSNAFEKQWGEVADYMWDGEGFVGGGLGF